ncbi:penicillin-binding protein, partial [Candidatus Gracilibacteria bacterium]|nr:penicillin-binding protein [Candidatus Gracilibacteria bacterium]
MNKKTQFNKKSLPQQKNLPAKDKLPTRQPSQTKDLGLKSSAEPLPTREPLHKKQFSVAEGPEAKPAKGWRAILSKKLIPHEKGWKIYLWYFIVTCLGLAVAGAIGMFVFILLILKDLPSPEEISQINLQSSTKILARDGTLLYEVGDEGARRTVIKYDQIHKHMVNATIAVEDDEFFSHPGFDWKGLTRSVLIDARNIITGSSSRQGGSTITQQLVKLTFLSPEKTIRRKLSELILAVELEQHYSKEKILEMYLNKIFYGAQSYGVEAASKTYFNKSAKDLTIAESAALAAIPQSPPRYSPYNNKDALLKRQQYILGRMHELGMLNDAEYTKAKNDVLVFSPFKETIRAPHFVFYVLQELEKTYGEQIRGLSVYTTLDSQLQENAELAIKEGAARNDKIYGAKNAGLISIDPKTGEILAMVGSKDYFDDSVDGQVNVITSKRQPGSTFKAFTYAALFTKGFGSGTVLFDAKTDFGNNYTPFNYDGKFRGPVTVRTALSNSLNVPAVASQYLAGVEDTLS